MFLQSTQPLHHVPQTRLSSVPALVNIVAEPFLASLFPISLRGMPLYISVHTKVTLWCLIRIVRVFRQSWASFKVDKMLIQLEPPDYIIGWPLDGFSNTLRTHVSTASILAWCTMVCCPIFVLYGTHDFKGHLEIEVMINKWNVNYMFMARFWIHSTAACGSFKKFIYYFST